MGTIIETISVETDEQINSSVEYSARAAAKCIQATKIDEKDIGLLVSIGIYKDKNTAEPSQAALIQKPTGLNLDPREKYADPVGHKYFMGEGTFSFDLLNGACGFINAAQVIDGFIKIGQIKSAIIVASDVHPSKKPNSDFPYTHVGAAAILTGSANGSGFRNFMCRTSEGKGYVGLNSYVDLIGHGTDGRNHVEFEKQTDYAAKLQEFSTKMIVEYVANEGIDISRIKYLVTNPGDKDFANGIARAVGLQEEAIIKPEGNPHTAAPLMGFQMVLERGLKEKEQVLFVSASAGITFACCIYEQ